MKIFFKILIAAASAGLLWSCKVNDIALYEEEPKIEFVEGVQCSFDDEDYLNAYVLDGESFKEASFEAQLIGYFLESPRTFRVMTSPADNASFVPELLLEEYYEFPAGVATAAAAFKVKCPGKENVSTRRTTVTGAVDIVYDNSSEYQQFGQGRVENLSSRVNVTLQIYPSDWNSDFWGAYSTSKYIHTPLVGVFTTSNQYILDGFTLQPHPNLTYNRIVYGKKYAGRENMPVGNGDGPVSMKGQKNGFAIIDGGSVWFAVPDQYALMYPAKVSSSSADMFDYEAADVCLSYSVNYSFLMYDSKYNRFLFYNSDDFGNGFDDRGQIAESGGEYDDLYLNGTRNNQQTMSEIGNDIAYPNAFDPSDIPAGFVIDDMEVSTGNGHLDNVLAVGHVGSTFHVYEFCMAEIAGKPMDDNPSPNCSAAWEVPVVGNVSGAGKIPVTTSSAFVRQFYYAAGNTLYRVDLTSSSPVPAAIWSAEDETAVITGLKFKSDNEDISYDEGGVLGLMKGITSDLGAIVRHSDGSCELVEFQMTTGGEIEKDDDGEQNIQIFEGFENVVDFIFSFRSYIR